jgi:hypothetical protein
MGTLEEEIVRPLKEQLAASLPKSTPHLRWWHQLFIGFMVMSISIGACGIFDLKASWGNAWRSALHQFQWLVFVKGDSLAVDEVGRFLKQQDGSRDVTYLSPEDAMQRFRGDKLAAPLESLDANPFPPCWIVTWKENMIGSARMQEAFQDTVALPGVVDVAYDTALIEKLRTYRSQWLQAKWILSALMLMAVVTFVVLGGYLLGRFPFGVEHRKFVLLSFTSDFLFWSAGFALVFVCLGPLPWILLVGGVIAGLLRWLTITALRIS